MIYGTVGGVISGVSAGSSLIKEFDGALNSGVRELENFNPKFGVDCVGSGVENTTRASFYVNSAGEVIPSTGYRYMDSRYADKVFQTQKAPLSYFGFTKFESASEARDGFQIFYEKGNPKSWSDAKLRGTFDTLQLFDSKGNLRVKVPMEDGNQGLNPEPIASFYPNYVKGGQPQLIPINEMNVQFIEIKLLGE